MILIDFDVDVLETVKEELKVTDKKLAFISNQRAVVEWVKGMLPGSLVFQHAQLDTLGGLCCPAEIWMSVLNDHQTWLLLDRVKFGSIYFSSHNNKANHIISMVSAAHDLIKKNKITDYFNQVTPHSFEEWVFAKTAENMGVNIWYTQETPVHWRFALYKGLHRNPTHIQMSYENQTEDESAIINYIEEKKSTRDIALPFYEKNRLLKNKNKYYNFRRDLVRFWKRLDLVLNKLLRYRQYNKYASECFQEQPFFVYFLHFQPERTSLPEGYGFASQFGAIMTLRESLPENIMLLVKEHPSTFTGTCSTKFRDEYFYKKINNIKKVKFVPIEEDTYDLMDRAIAIGTVTGTVAAEAMLRNVPTVMLGAGHSIGFHHAAFHRYSNQSSLSRFLGELRISKCGGDLSVKYVEYIESLQKNTASGFGGGVQINDMDSYIKVRARAQGIILSTWLSRCLSR